MGFWLGLHSSSQACGNNKPEGTQRSCVQRCVGYSDRPVTEGKRHRITSYDRDGFWEAPMILAGGRQEAGANAPNTMTHSKTTSVMYTNNVLSCGHHTVASNQLAIARATQALGQSVTPINRSLHFVQPSLEKKRKHYLFPISGYRAYAMQ